MSVSSDLRASLIERGFIIPNPEAVKMEMPLNHLQVSHMLGTIDVYETRFEGPIVAYDRDGALDAPEELPEEPPEPESSPRSATESSPRTLSDE